MGFRSTFITSDKGNTPLAEWFVEKYGHNVHFMNGNQLPISSKWEGKTYGVFIELEKDIQLAHDWGPERREFGEEPLPIILVWLHECGGITRCEIHEDKILYNEPYNWRQTNRIEHSYCYGCSDAARSR